MMIIKNGIITASFDESDGLTCTSLSFKGREYVYGSVTVSMFSEDGKSLETGMED